MTVYAAFDQAEKLKNSHTIVLDSLTYLLEMYVSLYVLGAKDTMASWGNFQQYFKKLMQYYVAKSTKNVIFTAHVQSILNEQEMIMEKKVPVQGALKKNGFVKLVTHHNRYFYQKINGGDTLIHTFISHGSKDYGDGLLSSLADQLKLSKKELLRFIDGNMTQEEYEKILKIKGII
jgi:hypothetical protein